MHLLELPTYLENRQNLDNLKYASLHSKAILFENDLLQIGLVSSIDPDAHSPLILKLHLINKKTTPLNVTLSLLTESSKIYINPNLYIFGETSSLFKFMIHF